MQNAPARKPTRGGIHLTMPISSARAMAGLSNDQKLAAIMTPAVNPSEASSALGLTSLKKKTAPAPMAVSAHVKVVAASACQITGQVENVSSMREYYATLTRAAAARSPQVRLNASSPSFSTLHATRSPGLSHTCSAFGLPKITP